MECPSITTWGAAYEFAHIEIMASFDALSHGDFETARALGESARAANALARELLNQ